MPYKDPERRKACVKKYYAANRDAILAQQKDYREANRDAILAWKKDYREHNLDVIRARDKEYNRSDNGRATRKKYRDALYASNKARAIEEKNGFCIVCFLNLLTNPDLANWHHIFPVQKLYEVTELFKWVWDGRLTAELQKTELVCESCHDRIHTAEVQLRRAQKAGQDDAPDFNEVETNPLVLTLAQCCVDYPRQSNRSLSKAA